MFDCTCNTQNCLLLNQHNGDVAPQETSSHLPPSLCMLLLYLPLNTIICEIFALVRCYAEFIGNDGRFGTTYRVHLPRVNPLNLERRDRQVAPKRRQTNNQYTLRNISVERRSHLHSHGNLRSSILLQICVA